MTVPGSNDKPKGCIRPWRESKHHTNGRRLRLLRTKGRCRTMTGWHLRSSCELTFPTREPEGSIRPGCDLRRIVPETGLGQHIFRDQSRGSNAPDPPVPNDVPANHRAPSGPTVIDVGTWKAGIFGESPAVVIRPILPVEPIGCLTSLVNHKAPSGPAVISLGTLYHSGNEYSVITQT